MAVIELSEASRDLMLRAMISMAAADGDVADVETATISAIFEKVTGDSVESDEIEGLASGVGTIAVVDDLGAAAPSLEGEIKEAVVKAAYLVLLADGKVEAGERKKLFEFASALKMPEIHVKAILEDIDA